MRFESICLILLPLWVKANMLPECYQDTIQMNSNDRRTVNSPNYPPYGFPVPSGCQWTIAAPIYHYLEYECTFYIGDRSYNCDPNDSLWIQTDGTTRLDNSNVRMYCGSNQQVSNKSAFNSITIGHTAARFSGYYTCNFVAKRSPQCDCGQRTQTRIVGGETAPRNAYPYMAVLIDAGTTSTVRGGATLISTTAVLTASHVFIKNNQLMKPKDVLVSVGRSDLTKNVNDDTPYSRNYEVAEILTHPQYNDEESLNDIALIKTKNYILFNRGVGVCCLPGLNEPVNLYDNQRIMELGFGTTDYGGAYSKVLKQALAYVLPNSECASTYDELTSNDLCTTTYNRDRNDTCQGDSGGPIIHSSFRDFIIGTVKDGIYCGGMYPGKCQRVSPFRPWIAQAAGPVNFFCYYKN